MGEGDIAGTSAGDMCVFSMKTKACFEKVAGGSA